MMTDTVLKSEGMRILSKALGIVEAERFIALMIREPFDYTEWQHDLYADMPLDVFYENVNNFRKNQRLGEREAAHL